VNSVRVSAKVLGRRGSVFEPIEIGVATSPCTAKELLTQIVHQQILAFSDRKNANRLLRVLTARELDEGMEAGKIASGGEEPDERVTDESEAVANALTAFRDGLYFFFVNGTQIEDLDEKVDEVREILFVRLTALAGG
jgi:hypothetical protein